MANIKLLALILVAFVIGQHQQLVISGTIEASLYDVSNKIDDLQENFDLTIKKIFYDKQPVAREEASYGLMLLSAKMAESIAIMHAEQRKMLLIVYDIVKDYFVEKTKPLDEVLMDNKHLIELVVQRSIKYSTRLGLSLIDDRLREIYLLLLQFDKDSHVKQLAREYFQVLKDKELMMKQAGDIIDQSWDRYIEENEDRLTDSQLTDTFKVIDKLIDAAIDFADKALVPDSEDPLDELDEEVMLENYVSPKMIIDIRLAIYNTVGKVEDLNEEAIEAVDMKSIDEYKRKIMA